MLLAMYCFSLACSFGVLELNCACLLPLYK
jgi:hypothetical protein